MPKSPAKSLTLRERQCQQVAREKARRKKLHTVSVRLRMIGAALVLAVVASAAIWEWADEGVSRTYAQAVDSVYEATARSGFAVRGLFLEGRSRTSLADVKRAMDVQPGEPILRLSLEDLRARLELLPTVKHASVERALPGTLHVRLIEREPVAIWQHKGKLSLIDDEGARMDDLSMANYTNLPLVIGAGAPQRVKELLELMASEPELAKRVVAAVRVSERRWNIKLKSGMEVKLPEATPQEAWSRLAELQRHQQVLERAVSAIDLRQKDRIYVKMLPVALPPPQTGPARET